MNDPKKDYQPRTDQLNNALKLESPGQILLGITGDHFFSTRLDGTSNAEAMREHDNHYAAMTDCVLCDGLDYAINSGIYPTQLMNLFSSPG